MVGVCWLMKEYNSISHSFHVMNAFLGSIYISNKCYLHMKSELTNCLKLYRMFVIEKKRYFSSKIMNFLKLLLNYLTNMILTINFLPFKVRPSIQIWTDCAKQSETTDTEYQFCKHSWGIQKWNFQH